MEIVYTQGYRFRMSEWVPKVVSDTVYIFKRANQFINSVSGDNNKQQVEWSRAAFQDIARTDQSAS